MDWYFDFISPYSYLQFERMPAWPAGTSLVPKPILFAALLNHWGQKGPAEIPVKRAFTYRQVQWLGNRAGIPFRFPPRHPFNPVSVLRLAVALDNDLGAIRTIFRFIWAEGKAVDTPEGFAELAKRLGMADAEKRIADAEVKSKLRRYGEEAIAAGVFGVPTLVVDRTVFWGNDATEMAQDYLENPQHFENAEMKRIEDLPVGVSRV